MGAQQTVGTGYYAFDLPEGKENIGIFLHVMSLVCFRICKI